MATSVGPLSIGFICFWSTGGHYVTFFGTFTHLFVEGVRCVEGSGHFSGAFRHGTGAHKHTNKGRMLGLVSIGSFGGGWL